MALRTRKQNIFLAAFLLMSVAGGVFWYAREAQGVNRTWDCGGGDNSWNNDLNWSGDTEPGASDVAIFDTTCTNSVTIDKSISVAGINIAAGYSGTITQSSTYTVTVGSSHFVQAGGTFMGGSGAITVNGTFTLSGGTFTSTSGTLEIGRWSVSETVLTVSGGTFNHNNGTVNFVSSFTAYTTFTINVSTTLTLYNVQVNIAASTNYCWLVVASGDTIIVVNDFTHNDGQLLGAWEVQSNVTISSGADGGSGTLTMTGTGSKTYTYSGGIGPHLRVNNASLSVSANTGTTNLAISMFSLLNGTFTAPTGTLSLYFIGNSATVFTISGGTFNHNNGTVNFNPTYDVTGYAVFTVDVMSSLTLYNVGVNVLPATFFNSLTVAAGDTLIVSHNLTFTDGKINGAWEVQGDVAIGTDVDSGTATLAFTGTGDQTYTDQGGDEPDGNITINKPVGTAVNLASNADWNAASQTTTITSGILNIGSYTLRTGGTLTVGANGVLHDFSTGDLILGGTVSNSGIIRLESSGSCGATDAISITSSSGGVQRAWSGSGVFTLWDTSIQDQGGTAKVQVNSGTSVSGNGTNFVFNSACNFTHNNTSLTNGLVGYWPMEENTGTSTADMSGNGNTGTLTNGPTWTTGQIGNAVNFDGTDDYVNIPNNAVYDTVNGTWALWVKFDSTPITHDDSIMSRANTSASWNGINLVYGSTGTVAGQFKSGGAIVSQVNASQALNDGTWHHISLVFSQANGGTNRLYIDGVESGSSTNSSSWTFSNQPVRLADAQDTYWEIVDGQIDEVRIYNRALSAEEVQQLYYNVRPSSAKVPSGKFQITNSKLKLP